MNIYSIADILTGIFEAIVIFMLFYTYLGKREEIPGWIYNSSVVVLAILINLCNLFFNYGMINVIIIALLTILAAHLFRGNMKIKIMISILSIVLISIIEVAVLFLITFINGATVSEVVHGVSLRLQGIIISKMLTFGIVKIICLKSEKQILNMKTSYWVLFFMIFAISILAIFLIFKLQYDSGITDKYNLSILCSIGLLYSTFFTLYLYENMAKQAMIISRQQLFEQQMEAQAKHLDEILVSQNQLKKFKHDLSNHLISLTAYFENADNIGGLNYIKQMDHMIIANDHVVETGNIALDAIINSKLAMAHSKKIKFTTHIQIPEHLSMEATDICIIFGNAIDNAIEACEKLPLKHRDISLSIVCENGSIICKIVNSAGNGLSNLETTKEDKVNHGFGIENIKRALSNYEHALRISQTDNAFSLSFIIFQNQSC